MSPDLSRRNALKLLAANMAALVAGCGKPPEHILPYVHMPERLTPGVPLQFATTLPLGGYGRGVLCSSVEGRPIKVSGNPLHPASLGATDVFAEADVLGLYDPDRSQACRQDGGLCAWEEVEAALRPRLDAIRGGAGFRLLTGPISSPTLLRLIEELRRKSSNFRWHIHDPLEDSAARQGSVLAFGKPLFFLPRLGEVEVLATLDADPLGPGPAQIFHARGFSQRRRMRAGEMRMSRVYALQSAPTLTGANADHVVTLSPGDVGAAAVALARALGAPLPEPKLTAALQRKIAAIGRELAAHPRHALVLAGPSQPPDIHALTHWINKKLAAPIACFNPSSDAATLAELAADLAAGKVDTLLVCGCNPAYDAPGDSPIRDAIRKARFSLHHGLYFDETASLCGWHVPESHPLEAWGDLRSVEGTASFTQPLIEPLYDTRTLGALLAWFTGEANAKDYDLVRATWSAEKGADFEAFWRKGLHDGVVAGSAPVAIDPGEPALPKIEPPPPDSGFALRVRPDPNRYDGSFANNAWLQECPKPLTKEVWGNSIGISPADADRVGVTNGDRLQLSTGDRAIVAPARIDSGCAEGVLSLDLGHGRAQAGHIGTGIGANAYALRSTEALWSIAGVEARKEDGGPGFLSTQKQFEIDGDRENIFPSETLDRFTHLSAGQADPPSLYPEHDYARADARWAMVIDSAACIGCNACVVACQVENNVPVVGPEEIARNRDMHWLRIDAYELGGPDGRVGFQPVPCMHCEKAPCEPVCPVEASVHDSEGLNVQVYNRCIGTRFCQANCPYKVRRFNFFGYADGQDFSDLGAQIMHARFNPDVTVRARGVMEKCTYCVQRISGARREAEKQQRPLREGDVTTACQDACPTWAIHFGDLADRNSAVSRLRQEPRHFALLGQLGTKPRTTYLADVRNPNPEMEGGGK